MPSRSSKRFLGTELLVDNPWHRYCKDTFRQRDGSVGEYYHIDMTGACGIIPLFADGTVCMLRVYRYLHDVWMWEFPIGGMLPGDNPLDVAKMELQQEAGLEAERWELLGRFAPYKGASNEVDWFFLAKGLRDVGQDLDPSEEIEVHRVPLDEARRLLFEQPLLDGQSVVGLNLFDRFTRAGPHFSPVASRIAAGRGGSKEVDRA